jgi:hypothetical protein
MNLTRTCVILQDAIYGKLGAVAVEKNRSSSWRRTQVIINAVDQANCT